MYQQILVKIFVECAIMKGMLPDQRLVQLKDLFKILMMLVFVFPFYWMLLTSVKDYGAYNAEHTPVFFTLSPTLGELTVVATDYAGNQTTVTVTVEPIPEEEGPAATGDSSHLLLWTAGMLLGLSGLAALAFVSTKRHKKS